MSTSILHQKIVLVLNRNWQAINTRTPAEAFCAMATDAATGLDIQGQDWMVPTKWDDWLNLDIRDNDARIGTAHGPIRVPTVIVVSNFARVPMNARSLTREICGLVTEVAANTPDANCALVKATSTTSYRAHAEVTPVGKTACSQQQM